MGCDIHAYAQRRTDAGWSVLNFEVPDNRNYDVFAILANVRNGFGFAGIPTGTGFKPIAEPRGLPNDMSAEVREKSDVWDSDGHSHSFLTLREIFEYDYLQTTRHEGILTLEEFADFDYCRQRPTVWPFPEPRSYASDVSGPGVRKVYPEEARTILAAMSEADRQSLRQRRGVFVTPQGSAPSGDPMANVYVRDTWTIRYLDCMSNFLTELVPLIRLGLDDVRLVFWFDN